MYFGEKLAEFMEEVRVDQSVQKKGLAGGGPITILTAVDKLFEQVLSKFFELILDLLMSAYGKLYICESSSSS